MADSAARDKIVLERTLIRVKTLGTPTRTRLLAYWPIATAEFD
jgi:hypothetical protein